jgi:hypothetical protein
MAKTPYLVIVALGIAACAIDASAQPLGVFRWQQLPYCNVLTLNVVQAGAVYQLDGTDDQCGAATRAAVTGMAFPNPDSTIGMGLAIVTTPGGTPLHLDATISLASLGGTWRDSTGASGTYVFTIGGAVPGSPRPVPTPVFPAGLTIGGGTITNVPTPVASTDAVNKAYVDGATASARTALLRTKSWAAYVSSSGAKLGTGRFTSSRTGVGSYNLVFDLTPFEIPFHAFPSVMLTPVACTGGSAQLVTGITSIPSGRIGTVDLSVAITNAAGVAVDCIFFAIVQAADANAPGSPVAPLSTDAPGDMSCTTVGDAMTCTIGTPSTSPR